MCHDLLWYWMFHCFLTPSLVLLGASAKFRCSRKLPRPSLLGRQVKTVIFISKIAITTKSPILHFVPMQIRWLLLSTCCHLGPRWTWYCLRTSGNWTVLPYCLLWFCVQKLVQVAVNCMSISHPRLTWYVHKWFRHNIYFTECRCSQMAPCTHILVAVTSTSNF